MQTVAPLITAFVSLSLAVAIFIRAPRSRLHRSYTLFAGTVAVLFFCLFFKGKGARVWQWGALFSSLLIAPLSLELHARVLPSEAWRFRRLLPFVALAAVVQVVALLFFLESQEALLVTINGGLVFAGLGLTVGVLYQASLSLESPTQRQRLRNGLIIGAGASTLMAVEMLFYSTNRYWLPGFVLVPPPLGTLAAAVYVYFLGEVIVLVRMLDSHEILTRAAVVGAVAGIVVAANAAVSVWVDPEAGRAAELINLFLALLLVLNLYEPLRTQVERGVMKVFFPDRMRLVRDLDRFRRGMSSILRTPTLAEQLLVTLKESGRAELASVYLWDEEKRSYVMYRTIGVPEAPPLERVPPGVFSEDLRASGATYAVDWLRHVALTEGGQEAIRAKERLDTLAGMNAEILFPFRHGQRLLGWLVLADSEHLRAYSPDERRALAAIATRMGVILETSASFERVRERDRLAALGEMAAGLAHEIRNPLGALKGAAQVLEGSDLLPEDREFIEIIVEETHRLDGVVGQFLDYARPIQLHSRPAPLPDVVQRVVRVLEARGIPRDVELELDLLEDMPPVPVDLDRLTQVLLNLLLNGVQALEGRQGRLAVRVRHLDSQAAAEFLEGGGGGLVAEGELRVVQGRIVMGPRGIAELIVEDTGPGIEAADMPRLFIPFFTTRSAGTGLGLPICRAIVAAHDGEIEVVSRPGLGARFTIRLPAGVPEKAEALPA